MKKLQFTDRHPPAKKLTPEAVRADPLLRSLIQGRLKEIREIQAEKAAQGDFPPLSKSR